jgi:DNA gyrase subunit B
MQVEVALQWSNTSAETLVSFVNCIRTVDGGAHLDGMKQAATRVINKLAKEKNLHKDSAGSLSGDHVREGLSAVRSLHVVLTYLITMSLVHAGCAP